MRLSILFAVVLTLAGALVLILKMGGSGESLDSDGLDPGQEAGVVLAGEPEVELAGSPDMEGKAGATAPGSARTRGGPRGSASVYDAATCVVRGRVVDPDGRPIRDADVRRGDSLAYIWMAPEYDADKPVDAVTGIDGTFELTTVPGDLRLFLGADGFAPLDEVVHALPGQDLDCGDFVLWPGVAVEGTVTDPSGAPLADCAVHLTPDLGEMGLVLDTGQRGQRVARSDAQGRYRIRRMEAGKFRLVFDHPHHRVLGVSGVGEDASRVVVIDARMKPCESISGQVHDRPSGLEGLAVVARSARNIDWWSEGGRPLDREVEVAEDGSFVVRGLKPGVAHLLKVVSRTPGRTEGDAISEEVQATAGDAGVDLTCRREHAVTLRVIDKDTRQAIEGFRVTIHIEDELWSLRDPEGRVLRHHSGGIVDGAPVPGHVGTLKGSVRAVGYERAELPEIPVEEPGQEVDLGLIELEPVPVLRVLVVDAETGDGVEEARVSVTEQREGAVEAAASEPEFLLLGSPAEEVVDAEELAEDKEPRSISGRTDERGVARMNGLGEGTFGVEVSHSRYTTTRISDLVLGPGAQELTLELHRGCVVRVRVVDPGGEPVPGAQVEHSNHFTNADGEITYTGQAQGRRVDADGWAHYRHLPPGANQFRIMAEEEGGSPFGMIVYSGFGETKERPWTTIVLEPGEPQELVLEREPLASIEGRVYQDGVPMGGATVRLMDPELDAWLDLMQGVPTATTDAGGNYRIPSADPGTWLLSVTHPSRAMMHQEELELAPGEVRVDVDLPVTSVSGRVTDADGDPVEGARVTARGNLSDAMVFFTTFADDDGEESQVSSPGQPEPVYTDHDGRYTLVGVQAGAELTLRVRRKGYVEAEVSIEELQADERRRGVDLVLQPGGAVDVRVAWADPDAAHSLFVTITWAGEGTREPRYQNLVGENTVVRDLAPGKWRIELEATETDENGDSTQEVSQEIEVELGQTGVVQFAR